jgi:cyclophilin family peptidyl-prolyl cis-trans isomerase
MNNKWVLLILLAIALIFANSLLNNSGDKPEEHAENAAEQAQKSNEPPPPPPVIASKIPGHVVELKTSKGEISFVTFDKDIPKTTQQIIKFVEDKGYDGIKFASVVSNFKIQTDKAKTKPQFAIPVETAIGLSQVRGAVGLARVPSKAVSGTSSIYILKTDSIFLNNQYTIFGMVIKGMDIVDKIQKNDTIISAKSRLITLKEKDEFMTKVGPLRRPM